MLDLLEDIDFVDDGVVLALETGLLYDLDGEPC